MVILALAELHRALWSQVYSREDLKRVVSEAVDLNAQPLTVAEEEFLNQALILFQTGWQMARLGTVHKEAALEADVRGFFSLPLVQIAWERSKSRRDEVFVRFVERALKKATA